MKPTELAVDHKNDKITSNVLIRNGRNDFVSAIINAAIFIGQTQYPRTQTLWNKLTFPPKNFALSVTTNPPTQMIKNIVPNIVYLSLLEENETVRANIRHNTRGPQRSPIRVS